MMIVVVSQHVAAGAEWAPADPRLVQLMNNSRRLRFRFRRNHPIDRAADTQTRQLREALATLRAHAEPGRDLFERAVTLLQLISLYIRQIHVQLDVALDCPRSN